MATKKATETTKKKVATSVAAKKKTASVAKKTTATSQPATSVKAKEAKTPMPAKKTLTRATVKRVAKPKVVDGFVEFLREQSVVGLAIGLVIGAQVKTLADQLIASFINPLIGLVLPGRGALDQKIFILHFNHKSAEFAWGSFVATLLSFLTTAAVVYFVFKSFKLDKLTKKKDDKKK